MIYCDKKRRLFGIIGNLILRITRKEIDELLISTGFKFKSFYRNYVRRKILSAIFIRPVKLIASYLTLRGNGKRAIQLLNGNLQSVNNKKLVNGLDWVIC